MIGLHPGPFTLRQLITMADAKRHDAWLHTAEQLAMLANINRDRKKRKQPYGSKDFMPQVFVRKQTKPKPIPADISVLKTLVKDKKKNATTPARTDRTR